MTRDKVIFGALFLAGFFIGIIIFQAEVSQTASNPISKILAPLPIEIWHALSSSSSPELQLNIDKTGLGTITSNPAGINCGSDCSEPYEEGTIVNLTAMPERGWASMGATCDYITDIIQRQLCELDRLRRIFLSKELPEKSSTLAVLMDRAKTVSFVFVPGSLLEVSKIGSGTVTSSPSDINCRVYENCRKFYATTTNITLTATPAANAEFIGWEGDCSGTGECILNMSDHRKVTAMFTQGGQYLLTVNKNSSGTITTIPSGIDCGSDCSEPYEDGTQVALTATADSGWVIAGLTFDPSSMRDSNVPCSQLLELDRLRGDSPKTYSCVTTMYAAKTATVTFAENRPPNLPSGLDQFKSDGFTQILEEETTNEDIVIFKARLSDSDSIRVRLQVELRQEGELFSGIEDGGILNSDFVNSGSEATITRADLADGQYHWRARAVDSAGNSSGWQEFGRAGNVDFIISQNQPPTISVQNQYKSDVTSIIPEGGTTTEDSIIFGATLQSSSTNQLRLEVEVEPTSTSFTGVANATSGPVSPGVFATTTSPILQNGAYHWSARAVDMVTQVASDWQEFGTPGNTDFVVNNLGQDAASLAKELVNLPYLWGGKGWDYNLNTFVSPDAIKSGYNYWNQASGTVAVGTGVDCSELIMWEFDGSVEPSRI